MKYLFLFITITLFTQCSSQNLAKSKNFEGCSIVKETFEETSMRKFLNTSTSNRKLIDLFLNNENELSFLSLNGEDAIFAKFNEGLWRAQKNETELIINNKSFIKKLNSYTELDIVYKLDCPNNILTTDTADDFKVIWIKKEGEIKFLYYSTYCDIYCLNDDGKDKIKNLNEVLDFIWSNKLH